jgi:hypothetical protein
MAICEIISESKPTNISIDTKDHNLKMTILYQTLNKGNRHHCKKIVRGCIHLLLDYQSGTQLENHHLCDVIFFDPQTKEINWGNNLCPDGNNSLPDEVVKAIQSYLKLLVFS